MLPLVQALRKRRRGRTMRKILALSALLCVAACVVRIPEEDREPAPQYLRLHPGDSRYFEFRGEPTVLIGSGEHYGAVLNLDFDYEKYLRTLGEAGLNLTRIFTGAYVERQGSFGIEKNTLAPSEGRLIAPWARSETPGYTGGGNRFDLDRWDENYFARLKDFVQNASERGIVVEVTFFSSIYSDQNWALSPLHPGNNVNLDFNIDDRRAVHTLDNGPLLAVQERLVRKLVRELNPFGNVIFEIQNEPYADRSVTTIPINPFLPDWRAEWRNRVDLADAASLAWQRRVLSWIEEEQEGLEIPHLIAQNFCNFRYPLTDVPEGVSILNFHYAYPEAVAMNYWYRRVVGFDETGFSGNEDDAYRRQAWRFILAGGALFNHLDYSFYPGAEDGTGSNRAPGGGSPALRRQLRVLKDFIHSFDFVRMGPDARAVRLAPGCQSRVLSGRRQYAIFVEGESECELTLQPGRFQTWRAEWIDTRTGETVKSEDFSPGPDGARVKAPPFDGDIALRLRLAEDQS